MLVKKLIYGGLEVYGGDVYHQGAHLFAGYNIQAGGTFQGIGAGRFFSTLQVDGEVDINAAIDVDIGASTELDVNDDLFRFSDGTNTLRVDSSNGIQLLGKTGVGASAHADYTFYVDENAVNGKAGLFKSFFQGSTTNDAGTVVDIDARLNEDPQVRFLENGVVSAVIGWDGISAYLCGSLVAGEFSSTTDKFRFRANDNYMYGDAHLNQYFVARTGACGIIIQPATGNDSSVLFREGSTTKFAIGYDEGDAAWKIRAGTSISGTASILIPAAVNQVVISSLAGTGTRAVYADVNGTLTDTPVAPERVMRVVGYYVDDDTAPSTFHDIITLAANSVIHKIDVFNHIAFDDPAVDTLEIGYSGDTDHFGEWDIRTTLGVITPTSYNVAHRLSVQRTVTAYLTESSSPSNGECYIYIWYSLPVAEVHLG